MVIYKCIYIIGKIKRRELKNDLILLKKEIIIRIKKIIVRWRKVKRKRI